MAIERLGVRLGGRRVVDGVTLTAESGRVLGLVGPNGSGKTTLLRTVYGALRPDTGRVLLDGRDVSTMSARGVARTVAVMLQDAPTEFDLTVAEAVLVGRGPHRPPFARDSDDDLALAWEAMIDCDVADLADRLVRRLSGGQRQRVMLARALAQQGQVLVLDEPTNHLDIAHQLDLLRVVRGLGRTVIAALHDLNLAAAHCDDVAVLAGGGLVAVGAPEEVLTPVRVGEVFGVEARTAVETGTGTRALTFHPSAAPPNDPNHTNGTR